MKAANTGHRVVVFVGPNENDLPARKRSLTEQWRDMEALLHEGLIVDVSDNYKDSIQTVKLDTNRNSKVVFLTDIAMYLFADAEERKSC
jgi:hypothetical protein